MISASSCEESRCLRTIVATIVDRPTRTGSQSLNIGRQFIRFLNHVFWLQPSIRRSFTILSSMLPESTLEVGCPAGSPTVLVTFGLCQCLEWSSYCKMRMYRMCKEGTSGFLASERRHRGGAHRHGRARTGSDATPPSENGTAWGTRRLLPVWHGKSAKRLVEYSSRCTRALRHADVADDLVFSYLVDDKLVGIVRAARIKDDRLIDRAISLLCADVVDG